MFYVYIIYSDTSDKYYVGYSNNYERRLHCRLPQKQYVLKVDKSLNFKNVNHEK
ncbi:MAG: GIY-YIG nuclease family protein, partial [Chitinophagaceae bacterium]|nr:GIY-YIG nuclease family protein [Chitinophagaceae bacterium]